MKKVNLEIIEAFGYKDEHLRCSGIVSDEEINKEVEFTILVTLEAANELKIRIEEKKQAKIKNGRIWGIKVSSPHSDLVKKFYKANL